MCPPHPHHIPPPTMVVGPKEVQKRQSPPFEVIDYLGTTWPTPPVARGHFPNRLAPRHLWLGPLFQTTGPLPRPLGPCHLWLGPLPKVGHLLAVPETSRTLFRSCSPTNNSSSSSSSASAAAATFHNYAFLCTSFHFHPLPSFN